MIDTTQIAKFIFDRHAENLLPNGQRADRIAFMVKAGPLECAAGGLSEAALAAWIEDAIAKQLSR